MAYVARRLSHNWEPLGEAMRTVMLPFLGVEASVREMTGEDEDLFADRQKLQDGRAFNHVMENCTESIAYAEGARKPTYNDIMALLGPDRLALMLAIREETFGDEVRGTVKCAVCSTTMPVSFLLSKMDTYKHKREEFGDFGQYSTKLEDGTTVILKLMNGSAERAAAEAPEEELMTVALALHVERVVLADGSVMEKNDHRKWLKRLSLKYRDAMRGVMEEMQLGRDSRFIATCPTCKSDTFGSVEQLQGFFFPSKSGMSLTTKSDT